MSEMVNLHKTSLPCADSVGQTVHGLFRSTLPYLLHVEAQSARTSLDPPCLQRGAVIINYARKQQERKLLLN